MIVELPAEVGVELIEGGLAGSADSANRSPGAVMDMAVTVVGTAGPVMLVAIADEAAKTVLREACRLVAALWQRRGDERVALELRRGDGRVVVKLDVSNDSPDGPARELLAAVDRLIAERSGHE